MKLTPTLKQYIEQKNFGHLYIKFRYNHCYIHYPQYIKIYSYEELDIIMKVEKRLEKLKKI